MKSPADQTLYELLDVAPDAPPAEIERAVERAIDVYGPGSLATYSLLDPEDAALVARRIEEAMNVLLDPASRARYDESLAAAASAPPPAARPRPHGANGGASRPWPMEPVVIPAKVTPPPPDDEEEEEGDEEEESELEVEEKAGPSPTPTVEAATAATTEAAPAVEVLPRPDPLPPTGSGDEVAGAAAPTATPPPIPTSISIATSTPTAIAPPAPAVEPAPPPPRPAVLLSNAVATGGPIRLVREIPPTPSAPTAATPAAPPAPAPAEPAAPEVLVPAGTPWTGELLRRVREARGITVDQISARTKVTRHHVENIEAERFGALPAPVYLRGILMSLARELRLDGQKVARSYLERVAGQGAPPQDAKPR